MPGHVKQKISFWENIAKSEAPKAHQAPATDNSVVQEQLASSPPESSDSALKSMLSAHLLQTGRVDPLSEGSLAKREDYSGRVLADMESSTQKRQKLANASAAPDQQRPLTHAVSGHGKGTDQVGRLVHGRRNDEIAHDKALGAAPSTSVALGANQHGLGDTATPEYTTVGSDPKNISGAFTTNRGMLHAVESGFAQATMLESHQRRARESGADPSASYDQSRFATQVAGPGEGIGYNLTLDGDSQSTGASVSPTDMQSRYEKIEREDGLKNATVVLDPAYIDGKRAGWQVQTAFANNDAPSSDMANPDQVGEAVGRWDQAKAAAKKVADARAALKLAKAAADGNEPKAKAAEGAAQGMKKGIDAKKKNGVDTTDLEAKRQAKLDEATNLRNGQADLDKAVDKAQGELDAALQLEASLA
jgi:hypothetical protein